MFPYLPNRGFTCKEIRMQEAEELYDLRKAMEAFAVKTHGQARGTCHYARGAES